MNWLYRLLKQNPESREGTITTMSVLGIAVNLLTAAVKILIGVISGSVAIVSEGANNATDAATSVLTLVGTRLSGRHPDKKHPFGYGRIEYLTGLIIAGLITFTGAELLISAVKRIIHPEPISVSYLMLAIVAASALIKFWLGTHTIREGKRVDSAALTAVGKECRGDSFVSIITILSALVFLLFGVSLDAYAGIITSAIILKAGIEVLVETVGRLLGNAGKPELAKELYRIIRANPVVINAADMMLHDYGPDRYSGSVNIEIDHKKSVEEVYAAIHEMQLKIMHEHGVTMVFGIYAVDTDGARLSEMRRTIASFVRDREHVKSYHALFLSEAEKKLYCDLIVDYELKDWNVLRTDFAAYLLGHYPDYMPEITIETEFV